MAILSNSSSETIYADFKKDNMKLSDYSILEVWDFKAILLAATGIRTVKVLSPKRSFIMLIVGVPPWRKLRMSDIYTKQLFEPK